MANGLVAAPLVPGLPLLNPTKTSGPTSGTANCTYPFPERICCCDTAPASAHPSHPLVLVRVVPLAVTFTCCVHTMLTGLDPALLMLTVTAAVVTLPPGAVAVSV